MDILIFGVCDVSRILDDNSNSDLSGKKAVLVLPADDEKAAWRTIQKARGAGKAGESIQEWLSKKQ